MATKLAYDAAMSELIAALTRDLSYCESAHFSRMGQGFEALAAGIPRTEPPRFNKLLVALSFWDAWLTARDHNWPTAFGLPSQTQWPTLARELIETLSNDQEIANGEISRWGLTPWREVRRFFEEHFKDDPAMLETIPPHLR